MHAWSGAYRGIPVALATMHGKERAIGTMLDAAPAKANLAADVTELACGLGSEGRLGPISIFPSFRQGKNCWCASIGNGKSKSASSFSPRGPTTTAMSVRRVTT